jgi:hypothetical protein
MARLCAGNPKVQLASQVTAKQSPLSVEWREAEQLMRRGQVPRRRAKVIGCGGGGGPRATA